MCPGFPGNRKKSETKRCHRARTRHLHRWYHQAPVRYYRAEERAIVILPTQRRDQKRQRNAVRIRQPFHGKFNR